MKYWKTMKTKILTKRSMMRINMDMISRWIILRKIIIMKE